MMTNLAVMTREINGGTQKIYAFPNGYGASVVRHPHSYGGRSGLWEMAVITDITGDSPNSFEFNITYDTEITGDVIGHLTEDEVDDLLDRVVALPRRI